MLRSIVRDRDRRARIPALLLPLVLAVSPAHAEIHAAVTAPGWIEARTANFRVITNAGERSAVNVARRLEQLVAFLAAVNPGLRAVPALPTDVYLLNDEALLERYKRKSVENILGFASPRPGRNVMVMNAAVDGEDKNQVLCHEFIHIYNFSNFVELPLWLNEGLAEYYGSFRPRGRVGEFARKQEGPLWWLSTNDLASLDVLFAFQAGARGAQNDNPAYWKSNPLRNTMYAQGWLITHYMGADRARAEKFQVFLNAIRAGATPLRAFEESYPRSTWPSLLAELKRYVKDDFLQTREVAYADPTAGQPPRIRSLGTGEVLANLGWLLIDLGPERIQDAEEHLKEAVSREPGLALAAAGLGHVADLEVDFAAAEEHYDRALAAGPADPQVLLLAGSGTLTRAYHYMRSDSSRAAGIAVAERAGGRFARYLAASPDNPEAQYGLAQCLVLRRKSTANAVRMLEAAAASLPSRQDIAAYLKHAREVAATESSEPAR